MGAKGREAGAVATLQERMFNTKAEMVYKLQDLVYQTDELKAYRIQLVQDLVAKVTHLNRDNFAVKQHLRTIDKFQKEDDFATLTYENILQIAKHIAPLYTIVGDRIVDTYGNWKYTLAGDYLMDTYGNRVKDLTKPL
jgi:type I restriction enzyme R subunit